MLLPCDLKLSRKKALRSAKLKTLLESSKKMNVRVEEMGQAGWFLAWAAAVLLELLLFRVQIFG